ncbi:putative zinc finger protein 66 [Anopheles moucheti]|uniref:putative zinc finger protein 66 n=1 Tax=Anopheles moucheti TaxID=186751 RepID=UPI0022F0429D|nr:putative zinc finger protein 66 [Anopheles moucheti]XP_052889209.1 putative zinc finger protein 66 [Anopheles moucheti]
MLAVFRKRCISNNYQFHQLWWRSCANRSSDTVEGVEYLYDSGADPLEVEYLVNEDTNSGPAAFHGSSLLQHEDTSETEEIPLVEAVKYDSNNSNNESPLTQQTPEEGCQQSVTTNSTEKHVLKDELLYSANYIELGEPHSEDDEPDLYGMEWTNNSHLNIIRSSKRSSRGSPKLNIGSILFNRISHKQEKPLCDTCGKVVTNLALHITSHKDELNYACPHCPIKMKHSSYLIRHIQSVHFKTIVKSCTACNIGFNHYETYRAHMYTQHGIGPQHECVVCSRRFHHACRLKKHVKQCHDLDEYDCEVCGRIFKLRENLNRHQKRVHTMGQPYKCSQCPKSFKCASYRKNHELIHHSGIVLKCTFCDKSFRYKYQVNAHISEMHSDANADSAVTEQQQ